LGFREIGDKLLGRLVTGGAVVAARDPAVAAWVLEARALAAGAAGDPGARVRFADAAAESFETAGDLRNACLQRVSLGYAYVEIGAYAQAERALRGALGVAERMGLDNAVGTARAQLGRTLAMCGRLDEADAVLAKAVESLQAQKNLRLAAVAGRYRAHVFTLLGDHAKAAQEARAAVAALAGSNAMRGDALAALARAQREGGAAIEALTTARQAMEALEAAGKTAAGEAAIRLEHAEALFASGDVAAAREAIAVARDRVLARARTILDSELRAGFLNAVAENARTLALAAAWTAPS
jgi:tetratricopeptide (TPR) repeat protein